MADLIARLINRLTTDGRSHLSATNEPDTSFRIEPRCHADDPVNPGVGWCIMTASHTGDHFFGPRHF